jgi:hypothetical protein
MRLNGTITENMYSTKDLILATFLKLNGIKLVNGYDAASKTWAFEDYDKCLDMSLILRNGESQVDILEYEAARRNLLAMVYDKKG